MGVYTGGTPNMSAIGLSLEVPEETFILLNASDLTWGAVYLLFLMTIVKSLFGWLLPSVEHNDKVETEEESMYDRLTTKVKVTNLSIFLGIAILVMGKLLAL